MRSTTREVVIDLDKLEPTVAMPHLPENTKVVSEVAGLHIDQVVIGSCTNGRIQRPAGGRCYSEGEKGGGKCALYRHPRHPGDHPPSHEGGAAADLHRGRLRCLHPHLRPLPGWTHGRHGRGGALPSPPPTATLWAAWAMCSRKSSWPLPPWPPPLQWPAAWPTPASKANGEV